jgi:hypothetical protein
MSARTHRPFSVCVFAASSPVAAPELKEAAAALGRILAREKARLVYGGGGFGLMGACAKAAHAAGGEVLGIIPGFLTEIEGAYTEVPTIVVANMHERKMRMFEESDAFVVMPGAIGTLEEAIELLSWRRLALHDKPIVFYNPDGFWDRLFDLFEQFIDARLAPVEFRDCWGQVDRVEALLPALHAHPAGPPAVIPLAQTS